MNKPFNGISVPYPISHLPQVLRAILLDIIMLTFGMGAYLAPSIPLAVASFFLSTACFAFQLKEMWMMFSA